MSSPRKKQQIATSNRERAYKEAKSIRFRAQQIVNRVCGYIRFQHYLGLDLPEHQRPQLKVDYGFSLVEVNQLYEFEDERHKDYADEVTKFLDKNIVAWSTLVERIDEVKRQFPEFEIVIVPTSTENQLDAIRNLDPVVTTPAAFTFASDEEFLRHLDIKPI
jgi:hypothetical protein